MRSCQIRWAVSFLARFSRIASWYWAAANRAGGSEPGNVLAGFAAEPANVLAAFESATPADSADSVGGEGSEPGNVLAAFARRTWYLGAWINHTGWYPDFQRRLFRRDAAQFSGIIHETLRFRGKAGRLQGDLLHYTVRSVEEHEQKVERYTTLAAQQMLTAGRHSWRAAMWLAPPWNWFSNYVLRLGFLDGHRGWVVSRMAARGTWLKFKKLGKLIEAQQQVGEVKAP
jgi:hypothetical protein